MGLFEDIAASRERVAVLEQSLSAERIASEQRIGAIQSDLDAERARLAALEASAAAGGIDVSEHNGDIDWARVRGAGVPWAFVRSSDGDRPDARYTAARVAAIRSADVFFGTYHFCRVGNPNNGDRNGRSEAAMAIYLAERMGWGRPGDLPLAADFENASIMGQDPAKCAKHLVDFVRTYQFVRGHWPVVYINPSTHDHIDGALTVAQREYLAKCPLWIANPDVARPAQLATWPRWTFWQHTWTGSVAGIVGDVDRNRFFGTAEELNALRIP